MYANGYGIPKDDSKAVVWYEKSATQGLVDAQFNLAVMYASGRGVPKTPASRTDSASSCPKAPGGLVSWAWRAWAAWTPA